MNAHPHVVQAARNTAPLGNIFSEVCVLETLLASNETLPRS